MYGGASGKLAILAFPCNAFGAQEPKDNAAIAEFAKGKGATFNVMEKVLCDNGAETHPMYAELIHSGVGKGDSLGWNFAKFLCNHEGHPIKRYSPSVNPMDIEGDIKELIEE